MPFFCADSLQTIPGLMTFFIELRSPVNGGIP